jgi:hypothetical protein
MIGKKFNKKSRISIPKSNGSHDLHYIHALVEDFAKKIILYLLVPVEDNSVLLKHV